MKLYKKRTYKLTQEEYSDLEKKYRVAKLILEEPDFYPIREYLKNSQTSAEQMVLNNTIRKVVQEGVVNGIKTMFHISKKEQLDELSGKYQAIRDFRATLELWIKDYEQLKEKLDEGYVEIC